MKLNLVLAPVAGVVGALVAGLLVFGAVFVGAYFADSMPHRSLQWVPFALMWVLVVPTVYEAGLSGLSRWARAQGGLELGPTWSLRADVLRVALGLWTYLCPFVILPLIAAVPRRMEELQPMLALVLFASLVVGFVALPVLTSMHPTPARGQAR